MTTFAYKIILDDSEAIMLEAALKMMIENCNKELALAKSNGESPKPPFWSHKHTAERVLQKLHSNLLKTSSNNF